MSHDHDHDHDEEEDDDDDKPVPEEIGKSDEIIKALSNLNKSALGKVLSLAEVRFDSIRRDRAYSHGSLDPEDDEFGDELDTDISQSIFESFAFVGFAVDLLKMHKKIRPDDYKRTGDPSVTRRDDGTVEIAVPLGGVGRKY